MTPRLSNDRRLKLGIVCEHLDGHAIGKLDRGLVRELARDRRFEVILMRPNRAVNAATGMIDAIAARVVEYPRSLFDARSAIAAEQCDVLFYPEIGMDELTYYLAFARLAPVQCVSWGIR
jgi:protein O-GlcNAc transferase